jgi:hypothetical protein
MINLGQRRGLGDNAAEYIKFLPYDLDIDGVGFWGIVPAGRSFMFEGAELAEFVRLCLWRMIDVGAVTVRHAESGTMRWLEQKQYGTERDQVAEAIIAEWQAAGGGDPPWEWLWFVTRRVLNTSKRWQADQGAKP